MHGFGENWVEPYVSSYISFASEGQKKKRSSSEEPRHVSTVLPEELSRKVLRGAGVSTLLAGCDGTRGHGMYVSTC